MASTRTSSRSRHHVAARARGEPRSVFDIIGRRKWFYAISLAVTIPGLLFILLTLIPNGNVGLRFSIAYRGGTEWTIHFANGTPEPQAVVQVLADQGLPGSE